MMATAMDADSARIHLLPIIVDMAADVVCLDSFRNVIGASPFKNKITLSIHPFFQVPNIRFNAAKELRAIAVVCGTNVYEPLIMPILNMLAEDDDRDVRFYADQSLNALDEEFATITK
jgi:hypothetical protein